MQYDGDFDHEALYNNIVALFELRPDHPWVHETYVWWDKYVRTFSRVIANVRDSPGRFPDLGIV